MARVTGWLGPSLLAILLKMMALAASVGELRATGKWSNPIRGCWSNSNFNHEKGRATRR
jgi:hypothetical protein